VQHLTEVHIIKSEQMEWLKEAGFKDIKCFEIDAIPSTVITAIK
jgi:hypothetical protein